MSAAAAKSAKHNNPIDGPASRKRTCKARSGVVAAVDSADFTISFIEKRDEQQHISPISPHMDMGANLRSFFSMPQPPPGPPNQQLTKPSLPFQPQSIMPLNAAPISVSYSQKPGGAGEEQNDDDDDDADGVDNEDAVDEEVVDRETGSSYHRVVSSIRDQSTVLSRPSTMRITQSRQRYRNVVLSDIPGVRDTFPYNEGNVYKGACWWDGHNFESNVVCLPGNYDTRRKQFTHWHGAFCSWECAMAYAHANNCQKSVPLLWHLRQTVIGKTDALARARHYSELRHYGGSLSVDEFRRSTILDITH